MQAYIALTYTPADREPAERLSAVLSHYGFQLHLLDANATPEHRAAFLRGAACLMAITSPAACEEESGGTILADIWAFASARDLPRRPILCVSVAPSPLDALGTESDTFFPIPLSGFVAHVAYPDEDAHANPLLLHRVAIRHLCRLPETFTAPQEMVESPMGRAVARAVAAYEGDPVAAYALAVAYEKGDGLPRLEVEAARWMTVAAGAGLPDARIRMGELLLSGRGTNADADAAYRLFVAASQAGDPRGDYHRGLSCLYGQGVMKDAERAAHYLHLAAETGYPPALYRLALLYRDGIGVTKNSRLAIRLLHRACLLAAGTGDEAIPDLPRLYRQVGASRRPTCVTMRQFRRCYLAARLPYLTEAGLARCFARSHSAPVSRRFASLPAPDASADTPQNSPHFRAASEGHSECTAFTVAEAATALGRLLEGGSAEEHLLPHPTRALIWYRFALHHGYAEAEYRLGDALRRGFGVPSNTARAVTHYRKAAERGDSRARFALGVCYERGIGVSRDPIEAARHYEVAARDGYAPAQNNLGGCYEQGIGVVQNHVTAVEWYARAAAQGQPDATCRLGLCYESGRGVMTDTVRAYHLYETAARHHHPYSLYRLGLCYELGINTHSTADKQDADDMPHAPRDAVADAAVLSYALPDNEPVVIETNYAEAVRLFAEAADGGVPDAAYALALCFEHGRGTRPDESAALAYLRRAAEGGHIQATYQLGLFYLGGRGTVRNVPAALACFARTAALWQAREAAARLRTRNVETEMLPADAVTPAEAAGTALYMLGYCALEGLDEDGSATSGRPTDTPRRVSDRVTRAADYFRRAADLEHIGALTALGDLHACGLLATGTAAADKAVDFYREAATLAAHTTLHTPDRQSENSPIHALMSLSDRSLAVAREAEAEGDPGSAELARVRAWKCLAGSAELGSLDALVGMAACAYFGHGTPENRSASLWFLRRAAGLMPITERPTPAFGDSQPRDEGNTSEGTTPPSASASTAHAASSRTAASLYLGDLLWSGAISPAEAALPSPTSPLVATDERGVRHETADEAYLRALATPCTETECGPWATSVRRAARRKQDQETRTEACYHLAVLRAVHLTAHPTRHSAFPYLAEAVLMGHKTAREDLARMYAYEIAYIAATAAANASGKKASRAELRAARRAARREEKRSGTGSPAVRTDTQKDPRAGSSHAGWLTNYYTALWPIPVPFSPALHATAVPADRPEYLDRPVTGAMLASALNYLADCYFEGRDLDADPAAAVTLWREVVAMTDEDVAKTPALAWARYSLGWCLLHGVGTRQDAAEAVLHLTRAARTHAEASYTLGTCHEQGLGMDIADDREAIKYYRRAARLGYAPAEAKVAELVARLKNN